jgi:hypothetical protein
MRKKSKKKICEPTSTTARKVSNKKQSLVKIKKKHQNRPTVKKA